MTYAATIPALKALVRAGCVENWQRISSVAPNAHHLRVLATYLQAPRPVRATWLCEREVLDAWFAANGIVGRARGRGWRPRLPDAAFLEDGHWVALEILNDEYGGDPNTADIQAKLAGVLHGEGKVAFAGSWFDEFRVVTVRGACYRYFPDGSTQQVAPRFCPSTVLGRGSRRSPGPEEAGPEGPGPGGAATAPHGGARGAAAPPLPPDGSHPFFSWRRPVDVRPLGPRGSGDGTEAARDAGAGTCSRSEPLSPR